MSRRARAVGFLLAAVLAAVAAAAIAQGYGARLADGYGPLRPVLVATATLGKGKPIDPETAAADLEVRRIPARFIPAGALRDPAETVGLVPVGAVPAGSYLLAAQLGPPPAEKAGPRLRHGRRPVEITVSGAGALVAAGSQPVGGRVDVVVTTEPTGAGGGRTYVAAANVPLLGLGAEGAGGGAEGTVPVTLALTRSQALRLIAAESFARRVTVIPGH